MAPERVHTVTDYYDGPRTGIADFRGEPHTYESLWLDFVDPPPDDWEDAFLLRPVDPETFALALEFWAIWLRWRAAFDRGEATIETHPALPADRARQDELAALIEARLAARTGDPIRATATFSRDPTTDDLVVEWSTTFAACPTPTSHLI